MMKRIVLLIVICISFLPIFVLAQEPARYNLASMQAGNRIDIPSGGSGIGKIYFYNIDGNRITHVGLYVTKAPDNWIIEIDPPLKNVTVEVLGIRTTVMENFYVEPSNTSTEKPEDVPEGVEYIMIPGRDYAPAKVAKVIVNVPEGERVGKTAGITVSSVAEWLGQGGAAVFKQTRDFNYDIRVVSAEFEEEIIEEPEKEKVAPGLLRSKKQIVNVTKEKVRLGLVGNEKLKAALEKALATPLNERAIENLAKLSAEIAKDVNVTRGFNIKDNRSTLNLTIKNIGKSIGKFAIHDVVPKTFASSADEITVSAPGASVEVIEKDPEYLFMYSELSPDQEVEISYTVDKEVSSAVIDEAEAALYAGTVEEVGVAVDYTWLGIAVVIIVLILVYFGFVKKKHKS